MRQSLFFEKNIREREKFIFVRKFLQMQQNQIVGFKQSRKDEYCSCTGGFGEAHGGVLCFCKNDNYQIINEIQVLSAKPAKVKVLNCANPPCFETIKTTN